MQIIPYQDGYILASHIAFVYDTVFTLQKQLKRKQQ